MWRLARTNLLALLATVSGLVAAEMREAPNSTAAPANQLVVAGNACGPTALLNAFRFGSKDWQRAADGISGNDDRQRILRIIREIGMRPSKHLPGRARWSRGGVSVADLKDMANEMTMGKYLPQVSDEVFIPKSGETPEKLLRRIHDRLSTSLAKGLPPVLSIRRYALRGKPSQWTLVEAHFVTLISIPKRLDRGARSFEVTYLDPWGGRRCQGSLSISGLALLSAPDGSGGCVEAVFPPASVGRSKVKRGEKSGLAVAAAIGRW
jgi:hypothetical protein